MKGTQGYFILTKNPSCMIEEILHITSCYIPSLAKRFFVECKSKGLKEKMFLKKVLKVGQLNLDFLRVMFFERYKGTTWK